MKNSGIVRLYMREDTDCTVELPFAIRAVIDRSSFTGITEIGKDPNSAPTECHSYKSLMTLSLGVHEFLSHFAPEKDVEGRGKLWYRWERGVQTPQVSPAREKHIAAEMSEGLPSLFDALVDLSLGTVLDMLSIYLAFMEAEIPGDSESRESLASAQQGLTALASRSTLASEVESYDAISRASTKLVGCLLSDLTDMEALIGGLTDKDLGKRLRAGAQLGHLTVRYAQGLTKLAEYAKVLPDSINLELLEDPTRHVNTFRSVYRHAARSIREAKEELEGSTS